MKNIQIAIIAADYRKEITDGMVKSCKDVLLGRGLLEDNCFVLHVPGALEIPLIAKKLAKLGKFDAIVAFGVILKGDTYHFEQVANESVRGCMDVSWAYEIPVIYEVLTVYDLNHARKRANDRGVEGAETALKMITVIKHVANID